MKKQNKSNSTIKPKQARLSLHNFQLRNNIKWQD